MKECRIILESGGILHISTPDLHWLVVQYTSGKLDEWTDVGWIPETSHAV